MIILIGLPKSGTMSFQKLFKRLGYRSYHWKKNGKYIGSIIKTNKENNKPLLSGFHKHDVITQMDVCVNEKHCYWPQIVDYQQLYYENPEATFILNKRDTHEILDSFKRFRNMDRRLFTLNPELISEQTDQGFIKFVNRFYKDVKRFFSGQPNSKFLSYHIKKDKIGKLRPYINLKKIRKFPKRNVNKKKRKKKNSYERQNFKGQQKNI